ncbi:2'-5' RNA ligase family protein [Schumannella sp. 10F1B-5-1]|uniref:2'-5' RNA ligase family protein n=1 Tax=Schumannella sp. 10F1B-5-1 TaxID=2590780 RepID=UPI001131180F|nr:2'-5' RNA ligase family protein [Schumannella sp. 10F1B-5-1]TPW71673.1 2'-5' RNA ligase family protein [Schumannella sp. 10F1B-5-1]
MVQSLELTLDARLDAAVRSEWAALAEAGLPSQAQHTGASNRPHVTLLVRDALPSAGAAVEGVSSIAAARLPLALELGAPVLFGAGERRVLARLVVPSAELLALHAELHAGVGPGAVADADGAGADAPHSRPGDWTPHVTLARRIPLARLGEALAVLDAIDPAPELRGTADALRHWDGVARVVTPFG